MSFADPGPTRSEHHIPPPAAGPLRGLRVLETGTLIAGPFAGRLLADMGADVIKIEAPGRPDPLREWGAVAHRGRKLWWPLQSRNKRLVTLNLRVGEGQELFCDLVQQADVVLENFRPGTLERWNLGPDRLLERNPSLVLARVSGFGQDGPYASRAGFGAIAEAMGGFRYLSGFPELPPPRTGLALGDTVAAMFTAVGVLAALHHRDATAGRPGQVIDVALMESVLSLLDSVAPEYSFTGAVRGPSGTTLPGIAPSNIYKTSDGKWIAIAANSDALFARLSVAIGQPELAGDPRFCGHHVRGENQQELDAIIAAWVRERSAAEVDLAMNEAGIVCGPVNTIADIFDDPHVRAREMLTPHEHEELGTFLGPAPVPRFSRTPGRVRWAGRVQPGADNSAVYGELLGLDEPELERLRVAGVV